MQFIFIYITNHNQQEAKKIAKYLLKDNLIACANIFPILSIYRWKGKVRENNEWILVGKTKSTNFSRIKTAVEKIHSYSVPCIIQIPIKPNKKFSDWLNNELKNMLSG